MVAEGSYMFCEVCNKIIEECTGYASPQAGICDLCSESKNKVIAVHLNHPCSVIDFCEVSYSDFLKIKCQGYVLLDELRNMSAELAALKQREAALVAELQAYKTLYGPCPDGTEAAWKAMESRMTTAEANRDAAYREIGYKDGRIMALEERNAYLEKEISEILSS